MWILTNKKECVEKCVLECVLLVFLGNTLNSLIQVIIYHLLTEILWTHLETPIHGASCIILSPPR